MRFREVRAGRGFRSYRKVKFNPKSGFFTHSSHLRQRRRRFIFRTKSTVRSAHQSAPSADLPRTLCSAPPALSLFH
jgi:hypothetical protein